MIGIQTETLPGDDLVFGVDEVQAAGGSVRIDGVDDPWHDLLDCHGCIGTAEIRLNPTGRYQQQRARPTAVACCVAAHEVIERCLAGAIDVVGATVVETDAPLPRGHHGGSSSLPDDVLRSIACP